MQEVTTTTTTFGNSTFANGLCLCSQCFWSRYFEEQAGFSWKVEWFVLFVLMFVKLKSSIQTFWKGGHEEAERDRERRPSVRGEVGAVWSARAARAERQCFDHAWRGTEKVGGRSSIVTFVQHVLAHNCFYRGATRIYIYIYIHMNVHPFSEPDFTWEIAMILRAGSMILFTKFGCWVVWTLFGLFGSMEGAKLCEPPQRAGYTMAARQGKISAEASSICRPTVRYRTSIGSLPVLSAGCALNIFECLLHNEEDLRSMVEGSNQECFIWCGFLMLFQCLFISFHLWAYSQMQSKARDLRAAVWPVFKTHLSGSCA